MRVINLNLYAVCLYHDGMIYYRILFLLTVCKNIIDMLILKNPRLNTFITIESHSFSYTHTYIHTISKNKNIYILFGYYKSPWKVSEIIILS